ncbi:uncharacterized protein MYCFIDRAFT_176510 [Pseudocercospora fijiensis CIRAD86]|uniref:Uncharacterized protein n=1 Tax=Pseudocercospora fijiensis (strain CIRAD86) TaxID=383855 RepID=M2YU03_PSEFD|nr:uncharacterized protein MYCFIDRAFT_176510 [Pseudocercospora fijiensis CIRAD86]EME81210.1 hypothetical protein MYCFIDRAFT_176510 [Pseudocercospora fijiensis CIRAD86]
MFAMSLPSRPRMSEVSQLPVLVQEAYLCTVASGTRAFSQIPPISRGHQQIQAKTAARIFMSKAFRSDASSAILRLDSWQGRECARAVDYLRNTALPATVLSILWSKIQCENPSFAKKSCDSHVTELTHRSLGVRHQSAPGCFIRVCYLFMKCLGVGSSPRRPGVSFSASQQCSNNPKTSAGTDRIGRNENEENAGKSLKPGFRCLRQGLALGVGPTLLPSSLSF